MYPDYYYSRGDIAYRLWMFDVLAEELKKRSYNQEKVERLIRQIEGYSKNQGFVIHASADDRDHLLYLLKRLKTFQGRKG